MLCILGRKQKQDVSATIAALKSEMEDISAALKSESKHQDLVRDPRDVSAAIAALMSEMDDLSVSLNSESEVRPNPQNAKSEMEVHPIPQNDWMGTLTALIMGATHVPEWYGTLTALIMGATHVPEWHDKEV